MTRSGPLAALSLVAAALASSAAPARAASSWSDHDVVAARLIAAPPGDGAGEGGAARDSPGGTTLHLGLHLRLAPGWHVYWRHPGDAGLPPDVALTGDGAPLPPPELLFPAPSRYRLPGDLVANGYSGEVVYPLRVALPAGAPAPARLAASVDYLACEDECIPFHDELELALADAGREEAELLARWEAQLPLPLAAVPGLTATAAWRGDAAGGELVLDLAGTAVSELFVAPAAGVVVGNPRWERDPGGATGPATGAAGARAIVPLRSESAGGMPARLRLSWVATGVAGAGAGEAVEGASELEIGPAAATPAGASAVAGGGATGGAGRGGNDGEASGREAPGPFALLARGAALALAPGALALLLLPSAPRRAGSAVHLPAAAAAAAASLAALLAAAALGGRLAGIALPLAEPVALAALALPHLGLALALWWGAGREGGPRLPAWSRGALGALLALPFAPLATGGAPAMAASLVAPLAVGFALPWLAASWLGHRGQSPADTRRDAPAAAWAAALGFLPAAGLAWVSYRMAAALPSARLATVQLAWLAAGLAAYLARSAGGRARDAWWVAAAAAAAASLWLAR